MAHEAHHHDHGVADAEIVRDPVCGMTVDPAAGKPTAVYEGRTYHFCCESCRTKFEAAPQQYLTAIDPVCGMSVDRAGARHFLRHAGAKFYFCSAGCKAKFEADPEKYLGERAGARADAERHALHLPDASRDRPGRPRNLPELRHGAGADGRAAGRCRPEPGAGRLHATVLDQPRRCRCRCWSWRWGRWWACRSRACSASRLSTWIELVLATPVVLWAAIPFFHRGWNSILNRSPNMWTLISIGVGTAYAYSVVAHAAAATCSRRSSSAPTARCRSISRPRASSSRWSSSARCWS